MSSDIIEICKGFLFEEVTYSAEEIQEEIEKYFDEGGNDIPI